MHSWRQAMPIRLSSGLACRERKRLETEQMSARAGALQQQNAHLKELLAHKNQEKHLLARWACAAAFCCCRAFTRACLGTALDRCQLKGHMITVLQAGSDRMGHVLKLGACSWDSSFKSAGQHFQN